METGTGERGGACCQRQRLASEKAEERERRFLVLFEQRLDGSSHIHRHMHKTRLP